MIDGNEHTVVREAFDKAEEYLKPTQIAVTDPVSGISVPAILSHRGVEPIREEVFAEHRLAPKRKSDHASMRDLDSLIAYTNRFKDEGSALFANDDRGSPSITAILDFHPQGEPHQSGRFGDHRASFAFPLSDEWKVWGNGDDKKMTMIDFASFLEDHIIDVLHPDAITIDESDEETARFVSMMGGKAAMADPARLLEIASNLQVNENSVVAQANKLASGEGAIEFRNEHETHSSGQKIVVPKMFAIAIPVFKGEGAYRVFARLRYRKTNAGIVFWYELWRTDRVFDHAFREAADRAASETELPLLIGTDR